MDIARDYLEFVSSKLNDVIATQLPAIDEAASLVAEASRNQSFLYVFGTGHSHLIAEELYTRAGGLANVQAILPPEMMLHEMVGKSTVLERLSGYAEALLSLYTCRSSDVMMIVSNSGRNATSIEMCLQAQQRGMKVIALTSLRHSQSVASRHAEGKNLYQLADVVLDNQAEPGDASYRVPGCDTPTGAISDMLGIAIAQAIIVSAVGKIVEAGGQPLVIKSGNLNGVEKHNRQLTATIQSWLSK